MFGFMGEYFKAKMINFFLVGVIIFILFCVFVGNPISAIKDFKVPEVNTPAKKKHNQNKNKNKNKNQGQQNNQNQKN